MTPKLSLKNKFLLFGIGFGLLFPLIATCVEFSNQGISFSFKNVFILHSKTPLLLIIDLAPLILGPIAYYLGTKQQKLEFLTSELNSKNQDQSEQLNQLNIILNNRNEDLEQMAYGTTHDLKSTLRGISSLVTFVEEETDLTEKSNYLNLLHKRVSRMEALLDSMLKYLRITRQSNKLQEFSLKELIDQVTFNFRNEKVQIKYSGFEGVVFLDKNKFKTILAELIENAIKFSDKEQTEISISSINNGVNLELNVIDNGPGIDQSYSEKIFKVYATLESRDEIESIGIGLAIVKRFTEDLNGQIELIPSKGAWFKLKIPL